MSEKELLQIANRPGVYAELERATDSFNELMSKKTHRKKNNKTPISFRVFDVIAFLGAVGILYVAGFILL